MPKKVKKGKNKVYKKEILFKVAAKLDFIKLDFIQEGGKKVWTSDFGIPYWIINSDGEIGNGNYVFNEDTDLEELSSFIKQKRVLITKKVFDLCKSKKKKKKK